ncbi:MAG: arylamine N-acetyltransferase [Caulobacteraceae bacterium]|nr:arylamine N-acetyltransferase [Caulobacteraceae bacterium]
MSDVFDLDAYLARVGYAGPREPTLATLAALHALHPAAIPFENLDPLLERPVRLDLASLQAKLVAQRRGGYCFEQNALFRAALQALGFSVTGLSGRVRWMSPPDGPDGARSHMLLRVELEDGPHLADIGFGGHLFAAPIRLSPGIEQATPASTLRLAPFGEALTLQTRLPDGWRDVYRFTLEPQNAADYEMSNWFTSTHPASLFRNHLLAERLTPERRVSLFNTRVTERYPDGRVVERILEEPAALARALDEDFGLTPPADPEAVFARLPPA